MSIINSDGLNTNWQLNVLRGLQGILDEAKLININTDEVEQLLTTLIADLQAGFNVTVVNGTGNAAVNIRDGGNSITVDAVNLDTRDLVFATDKVDVSNSVISIDAGQFSQIVKPNLNIAVNSAGSIAIQVYSISFASNGTGPALVSVDEGNTYKSIPTGTTINLDAGGLGWVYEANRFAWDTTTANVRVIKLTSKGVISKNEQ
jgi:hypothetical protein